jgi:hypothetical protein
VCVLRNECCELELHRICVEPVDGEEVCSHVNSSASIADVDA